MRCMHSLIVPFLVLAMAGSSHAGPNAGGTLILHDPNLVYTTGIPDYCGEAPLAQCEDGDVRIDGGNEQVWKVYVAFPLGGQPRLMGAIFGIYYDDAAIYIFSFGTCSDFELTQQNPEGENWPAPGSGTSLIWDSLQTDHLVEVYWFAGYNLTEEEASFALGDNPLQEAGFCDDSAPCIFDPVTEFGALGFNTDGYLACPDSPIPTESVTWGRIKVIHR